MKRLPVYPLPEEDELLSSYVARLAAANGLSPARLTKALGLSTFWRSDVDLAPPANTIAVLRNATGHNLSTTTLTALTGETSPRIPPRLVLTPRTRWDQGMPVCPQCLQEGWGVQRAWRLATTVVCSRHRSLLVDACALCRAPIKHVKRQGGVVQPHCSFCHSTFATPSMPADFPLEEVLILQDLIQQILTGHGVIWDEFCFPQQDFVALIYALAQLYIPHPVPNASAKRQFEASPLNIRRGIVSQLAYLTESGFISCLWLLRQEGIRPLHLCSKESDLPKWLNDVLEFALAYRWQPKPMQGTFKFTDEQWERWSGDLPAILPVSDQKDAPTRQILEEWITYQLRGQKRASWVGELTYAHLQRGFREFEKTKTFTTMINDFLRNDGFKEVLTFPDVVICLLHAKHLHSEVLWHQMLRRMLNTAFK